ncbi:hypothetical protein SERLA73DRAFT_47839, partial [Serpula lacrymans var. lacrymans S7.3]
CLLIPRKDVRQVLHDHFDEEFDKRLVGSKNAIGHIPLNCLGPWHHQHMDGHDKLVEQTLRMGGKVSLPIYSSKDQFVSFVPYMCVLPNVYCAKTIAHVFLDMVEMYGCIPLQLTADKGSEVGEMIRSQETLW